MSGENVSEGQAKRVKGEKLCSLAEAKLRGGERINFPPLPCSSHPLYSPTRFSPPTSSSQRRLLSNRHAYSQKRKGTCSPLPLYKRPHCPITTEGMGLTPHFHFWSHNSSRSKPKSLHKQWRLISNDIARIILIPFRSSESLAISDQDDPTRWQHSRCPVTPPPLLLQLKLIRLTDLWHKGQHNDSHPWLQHDCGGAADRLPQPGAQ